MLLWTAIAHGACDVEALTSSAEGLAEDAGPEVAGPLIAAACPRPTAWKAALEAPTDPQKDLALALAHPNAWARTCEHALGHLHDGFRLPSPGQRLAMWLSCDIPSLELMDADEWMAATGPPLVTLLAADRLERENVPMKVRQPLLRALAGVPAKHRETEDSADPLMADPLAAFRTDAEAHVVNQAKVTWPIGTNADLSCHVRLDIGADGTPSRIKWEDCPDAVRPNVEMAIAASWFEPARKNDRATRGRIQLVFSPRK